MIKNNKQLMSGSLSFGVLLTCYGLFFSSLVFADQGAYLANIDSLLKSDQAPEGVVFEVVNRDYSFLDWALPEVKKQSARLRKKFPDVDIVIVSHGREMFALTEKQQSNNPDLKAHVDFLATQQIPVYVCGTYAEWQGVSDSDFPENIRVAAAGPVQINDYIKLGYVHIILNMN